MGSASVAIRRSLADEERKLRLVQRQGEIDTYSPKALADLRTWVEEHPADPYADEAKERHDECVETLRQLDEPFYDWSDDEIESLETFNET
ncbi:hypothetical protein NGM07_20170 (plasmid) [Halorussus vallis]|uniref:hypothetical protein n=1 Tax=Halorussus vallis TaxID=2953749 RepID=UPI0020A00F86|nr:hypothetical protein [Halorussus vallis]USZ77983.1 hypothetical protein NGM07_20170 [Halorussus vallis]